MKVFLVEDEYIIREGIKNIINWEGNGYTFCGEAADGELALPLISKTQPDIVITDIKMPFMDGLELSRLIKQKYPNIEIIILSGYDEFDYAKQGISIGVAQYLLKPISGADLLKAVNEV
ncbi:MAG: response regulator, partial [Lachnospiraceae bacterium]|nr:response regulator [Lachnospiraceae bacterium]